MAERLRKNRVDQRIYTVKEIGKQTYSVRPIKAEKNKQTPHAFSFDP